MPDLVAESLRDMAQRNAALGPLTTYRVGGAADWLVHANDVATLERLGQVVGEHSLDVLVVGRGSNLLVADDGFRGVAITLGDVAAEIAIDATHHIVTVGSTVLLPVLARKLASQGLSGFEWAVGVPGSIGGAVRMNAGGHGSDIAASLIDVQIFDLATGAVNVVPASGLGLRFRGSGLGPTSVVLSARLQLAPGDPAAAQRELGEIVAWRRANQPGGQNAGSVFVNPVPGEVSAGQLIDELGMRGLRLGGASVSDKHANFIQASEDGCANDVRALMRVVADRVEDATGYALRSEIRLIGFES